MTDLCVAHLVRRTNPPAVFQEFLHSYATNPAGEEHDLLIIFKGFSGLRELAPYEAMLEGVAHRRAYVHDYGFDIGSYRKVASSFPYAHFAFLNSFCRIAQPGWLQSMRRHAQRPGVGVVGATASHQSILSDLVEMRLALQSRRGTWMLALRRHGRYFLSARNRFSPYPNPHVRTNAFLIGRELFRNLRHPPALTKWDAYRFESGVHGLTQQIVDAGFLALVVGRDGQAYESAEWPDSRTFWCASQENLLVEDNQTKAYANGDREAREKLAYLAWRRWPDGRSRIQAPMSFFAPAY